MVEIIRLVFERYIIFPLHQKISCMNTIQNHLPRILFMLLAMAVAACSTTKQSGTDTAGNEQEAMDALLWKIEGKDLTEPSYLYGTIHIISQNDFFLTDATKQAFDESQKVVLELDMDDPQMPMQMMQYANMQDGQTLDQLLSEETYQKLDELVM